MKFGLNPSPSVANYSFLGKRPRRHKNLSTSGLDSIDLVRALRTG